MAINILIADDHAVFRSGLRALLEKEPDFVVVAEAGTGDETVSAIEANNIDVVTLDISMPGTSASKTCRTISNLEHAPAIVILTMHEDEYYVEELFKAGATAFVLKKSKDYVLFDAIRSAHKNTKFIDPALASKVVSALSSKQGGNPDDSVTGRLTQREREVCGMLALGHTNVEIAEKLHISVRTVETHRMNIMSKLDLGSRAELVRYAIDNELRCYY